LTYLNIKKKINIFTTIAPPLMNLISHISKQLLANNLDSIILTNSACEIEYANKIAIELYGYSLDEFKGKHINIFDVPKKEIPAESWEIHGKTGRWTGEAHRKRKDGSVFFASLSIFSILDDDGKLIGFAGNTKDVTNTINIQEALFEKQRQLVSIIDNTEDVIVSIDRNFRIVEFNLVLASFVKRGYNYDLKKGDYMLDYIDPNIIT
jgi:PAS domain S-box-containing protein